VTNLSQSTSHHDNPNEEDNQSTPYDNNNTQNIYNDVCKTPSITFSPTTIESESEEEETNKKRKEPNKHNSSHHGEVDCCNIGNASIEIINNEEIEPKVECPGCHALVVRTKKETKRHQGVCFHKIYRCGKCFALALSLKDVFAHKKECTNSQTHEKRRSEKKKQKPSRKSSTSKSKKKKNDSSTKYQCDECDKLFKSNHNLKEHMKGVHIKSFSCPYQMCKIEHKRFGHRRYLRMHIQRFHLKLHETCEFCKKMFYDKNSLRKHVNEVHLQVKPYACIMCQKSFARRETLDIHINTHGDKKDRIQFKCEWCGFNFAHKNNLQRHWRTAHANIC